MSGKLKGSRVYLAGPMDRVPDGGVAWREKITPILQEMGILVLNPCDKPTSMGRESKEDRDRVEFLKKRYLFDDLAREFRTIRTIDLRMVDVSDFMIAYVNTDIHLCGTYEEIFLANRQKKPILIWCEQGKQNCPNWLFFTLPHQHIFDKIDHVINHVKNIDEGMTDNTGRWVVFHFGDKDE